MRSIKLVNVDVIGRTVVGLIGLLVGWDGGLNLLVVCWDGLRVVCGCLAGCSGGLNVFDGGAGN